MFHSLYDEGSHYSKINEVGEFIFEELHTVVPHYLIKEHINTKDGLIVENNEIKYLGVIFDSSLNFRKQIHTHVN